MRILFAGKRHFDIGGVERSTHQLAVRLLGRGHAVAAVATAPPTENQRRPEGVPFEAVRGYPYDAWATRGLAPAIALREAMRRFDPDVVVVSGGGKWYHDWTMPLIGACESVPCALYVRDRQAVDVLGEPGCDPDLVLTNAEAHSEAVRALGREATTVPSLIEPGDYRTPTTGEVVLYVNPVPIKGLRTALTLAASRPDVPFVFLRCWSRSLRSERELLIMAEAIGNIEVVDALADPRPQYARARVLLAPYEDLNRPRVVFEAQVSGIPVLARDDAGIREAVGAGGILVPTGSGPDGWTVGLARLWDDPVEHARRSAAAFAHAARPEVDPERIAARVEQALAGIVGPSRRPTRPQPPPPPAVSVVIPARNVAHTIDRQLAALAQQDFPGRWELVVSDNGCDDDTRAHVLSWTGALPAEVRIVDSSTRRGVAHARNVGIAASRGDLVLICDGDDEVEPGWIRHLVTALRDNDIVTGAGDRVTLNEPFQHAWMGLPPVTTAAEVGYSFLPYASGGNLGVRRSLAMELPFDEGLRRAEDIDWSWRAHYAGQAVGFAPEAVIRYRMRAGLPGMALTRFRGGIAEPLLYRRYRRRGMPRASLRSVAADYRSLARKAQAAARDPEFRYAWVAQTAKRAGRAAGSVRHRTLFL